MVVTGGLDKETTHEDKLLHIWVGDHELEVAPILTILYFFLIVPSHLAVGMEKGWVFVQWVKLSNDAWKLRVLVKKEFKGSAMMSRLGEEENQKVAWGGGKIEGTGRLDSCEILKQRTSSPVSSNNDFETKTKKHFRFWGKKVYELGFALAILNQYCNHRYLIKCVFIYLIKEIRNLTVWAGLAYPQHHHWAEVLQSFHSSWWACGFHSHGHLVGAWLLLNCLPSRERKKNWQEG